MLTKRKAQDCIAHVRTALFDELQMDFEQSAYEKVIAEIKAIESELFGAVEVAMRSYDQDKDVRRLEIIAKYYLKKRYLLRIKDNLDKFVDV